MAMHKPLHPGKVVREVLIDGASLSVTDAALHLGVSRTTLSRLLNAHIGISPDMAIRLSKLFKNTDVIFWMNLQRDFDIWVAQKNSKKIRVVPLRVNLLGAVA